MSAATYQPRPIMPSGKAYRVVYHRETVDGFTVVPGDGLFGWARVQCLDRDLVLATAQQELDKLAEGEPGTVFVGLDWSGDVVCRAHVPVEGEKCPF